MKEFMLKPARRVDCALLLRRLAELQYRSATCPRELSLENDRFAQDEGSGRPASFAGGGVCVFLALAVLAVFGQTAHFDFVGYDDPAYVSANPVVAQGCRSRRLAGPSPTRKWPTGFR